MIPFELLEARDIESCQGKCWESGANSYRDAQHIHDLFQFSITTELLNFFSSFDFNIGQKFAAVIECTSTLKKL